MAIHSMRTLAELQVEAFRLGLEVTPTKKTKAGLDFCKEDYIIPLREHFLKERESFGQDTSSVKLIMNLESPMLAEQFKKVKPDIQKVMFEEGGAWIFQEKVNGNRLMLCYVNGKFDAFSRHSSVEDHLPISYKDNILLDGVNFGWLTDSFIIDCEVISTNPNLETKLNFETSAQLNATTALLAMDPETSRKIQKEDPLEFKVFDILYYQDEWITDKRLLDRLELLPKVITQLVAAGFKVSKPLEYYTANAATKKLGVDSKQRFYEYIVNQNGEGVVAKNIYEKYYATTSRTHRAWVKVKRSVSESAQSAGLVEDTIDAWISGFEPGDEFKGFAGMVGSLIFSINMMTANGTTVVHEIAKVSGISLDFRKEISMIDENGNVQLRPEFYGRVFEVDGMSISAVSKRLNHAILGNYRPDRSPDTCFIDELFLDTLIF